ncbi:unnamed protein product [Chondrus crispus]|uniref:Uncharacterized protein n=1 Tax=Chondrus crispus TaxID=2769 RepID=R7QFB7_CHOCR|nr:unnamed protein product [Chondrus crispus]CDF36105.1 unnamed protein product [Chondrus crispus]|eukprot:XP_005715924.1 unnamed protein product [Chondrus crispus]
MVTNYATANKADGRQDEPVADIAIFQPLTYTRGQN